MTPQERFAHAKELLTRAAIATLRGWPLAEVQARQALEELNAARAELRNMDNGA
jgi:hypothetical protein